MNTSIEQIAKFHHAWSSKDVKYALMSVAGLTGPALEKALDDWQDGLHAHGWEYQGVV